MTGEGIDCFAGRGILLAMTNGGAEGFVGKKRLRCYLKGIYLSPDQLLSMRGEE
jgi:hypothetical protein